MVMPTLATSHLTAMRTGMQSCVFSLEKRAASCFGFVCLPVLRVLSAGTARRALPLMGLALVTGRREILDTRQTAVVAAQGGGAFLHLSFNKRGFRLCFV